MSLCLCLFLLFLLTCLPGQIGGSHASAPVHMLMLPPSVSCGRLSPPTHGRPRPTPTECRRFQARGTQAKGDGPSGDATGTAAPAATPAAGTSDDARELGSRQLGPVYVPSKAAACARCAACKQQRGNASVVSTKCKMACKYCPDVVIVGAEDTLSIQVDGITATQYVRDPVPGSQGQGRALQSELNIGVTVTQRAITIFEGIQLGGRF